MVVVVVTSVYKTTIKYTTQNYTQLIHIHSLIQPKGLLGIILQINLFKHNRYDKEYNRKSIKIFQYINAQQNDRTLHDTNV